MHAFPLTLALLSLPLSAIGASFDFYVYALSYQPEFCYNQPSYPGCSVAIRDEEWQSELTIHGMWPEFADGTYPQTCSEESEFSEYYNQKLTPNHNLHHPWGSVSKCQE